MPNEILDNVDRRLLSLVQRDFPLIRSPWDELGRKLDISGDEVILRLGKLKSEGLVRQIGPVLDASRLGYQSTLAAMKLDEDKLAPAALVLQEHEGISHAYLRDHEYNIWFTLAVPREAGMAAELDRIARACGVADIISLPAVKVFKLHTYFDMGGDSRAPSDNTRSPEMLSREQRLTRPEKLVINELQQDLPLSATPFAAMASHLGFDEGGFMEICASLMRRGIIRRYGASLDHNRAGYNANALTCWYCPPDKVSEAGSKLAAFPEVSHCYERKTPVNWKYNLFAMLHSRDTAGCKDSINRLSAASGLDDFITLFTIKELKKTRIKYAV